jgi:hypothetical protein
MAMPSSCGNPAVYQCATTMSKLKVTLPAAKCA